MKNILQSSIAFIFLLTIILLNVNNASAEINLWTNTIVDSNSSTVSMYELINVGDTSTAIASIPRATPVTIRYDTQLLPYNISQYYPQYQNAVVDWCNLTLKFEANEINTTSGQIQNYSTLVTSYYFTNFSSGTLNYNMNNEDVLSVEMKCHYTNPDTLFIDSVYFGQFAVFFPARSCTGCDEHSFEQLTQANDAFASGAVQELGIYGIIQNIVEKNFQLWFIVAWILRIGILLASVGLIFAGVYFMYVYITKLAGDR